MYSSVTDLFELGQVSGDVLQRHGILHRQLVALTLYSRSVDQDSSICRQTWKVDTRFGLRIKTSSAVNHCGYALTPIRNAQRGLNCASCHLVLVVGEVTSISKNNGRIV